MTQQFPQKFGPYTLHQIIARGGMAEIYRATMPGIGSFEKQLVIKKILPHLVENEEYITMLIDEARILVGLNHANIAQVYDLGEIDGTYYIAMEFVHGGDISTMIKEVQRQGQFIPYEHTAYMIACLCMGLHVAHTAVDQQGNALNIVHRDISPQNVLVSFAGDVKVIDFGIAKARSKDTSTKAGVIKGKLLYMAPEQAMAQDLDGRADLFAAGLCMYKMLTHRLPFEGENEFQIYNNILTKVVEPPSALREGVPASLDQICMKLLERDPNRRYQDGYAAKRDLDRALHALAPGYTPSRLSRFVEDKLSHIVQQRQQEFAASTQAAQAARDMAPTTPLPRTPGPSGGFGVGVNNAPGYGAAAGGLGAQASAPGTTAERVRTHAQAQQQQALATGFMPVATPVPGPGMPEVDPMRAAIADADTGQFQLYPEAQAPAPTRRVPPIMIGVVLMALLVISMLIYALVTAPPQADPAPLPSQPAAPVAIVAPEPEPVAPTEPEPEPVAPTEPELLEAMIATKPEGAQVIDAHGDHIGKTPYGLQFPSNELPLRYTVQLEGFEPATVTLTSESLAHSLVLEPVKVAPEPTPKQGVSPSPPKPTPPKPTPPKPTPTTKPTKPTKPVDDFIDLMPVKPTTKPAAKPATKPSNKPVDDLKDVDISW